MGDRGRPVAKLQQTNLEPSYNSSLHKQKVKKRPHLKIRWDRDYAITKELHQSIDRVRELSQEIFKIRMPLNEAVFQEYWQRYSTIGILVACFRSRYGRHRRLRKWKRSKGRLRSRA
jgi:hypothetical protein